MIRSVHFIPAHRSEWLEVAARAGADAVIIDLEDGLPDSSYAQALIDLPNLSAAAKLKFGANVYVRVRAHDERQACEEATLLAAIGQVTAIIPKTESPDRLEIFRARGVRRIVPLIESFVAFDRLDLILSVGEVAGLAVGFEDLLGGAIHAADELGSMLQALRVRVAVAARARNVPGIDSVSLDLSGGAGIHRDCNQARDAGLTAKFTIHPSQIPVVNAAFSVSLARLEWAKQVIELYTTQESTGGYSAVDSILLSKARIATAKTILAASGQNIDQVGGA